MICLERAESTTKQLSVSFGLSKDLMRGFDFSKLSSCFENICQRTGECWMDSRVTFLRFAILQVIFILKKLCEKKPSRVD